MSQGKIKTIETFSTSFQNPVMLIVICISEELSIIIINNSSERIVDPVSYVIEIFIHLKRTI